MQAAKRDFQREMEICKQLSEVVSDYQIPVTQLKGPKGMKTCKQQSEIEMRPRLALDRFKRYGR